MSSLAKAGETRRQQIVELMAKGHSQNEIAKQLGITQQAVSLHANKPKSIEEIEAIRMRVRSLVMEEAADGLVSGTLGVVRTSIKDGDAKSLELSTRAALNLEKLTASASGEAKRVEVKDVTPPPTATDLKVLIAQLMSADRPFDTQAPLALTQ